MGITAALGIMAVGVGFSAVGQRKQGQYKQQVAEINAGFAEEQAADAVARGVEEEQRLRVQIRRAVGQTRAAYGAQGVEINEGSSADVQASIAYMGELDAITLRNNAAREAWGYKVQGASYRMQGGLDRYAGNMQAAGTILGGAYNYYQMKPGVNDAISKWGKG